jgi:hypothetical protein
MFELFVQVTDPLAGKVSKLCVYGTPSVVVLTCAIASGI